MLAQPVFSRLLISVSRRLPFKVESFYVPALRQVVHRPGDSSAVFHEIFVRKLYEPMAPLPAQPTIVDLGSNVGFFTIFFNQRVSGGKIFVFEASPKAFVHLKNNISRMSNSRNNEVKLYNVAICNYAGEIDFMVNTTDDTNVAASAFRDFSHFSDAHLFAPVRIPCNTLSHFVEGKIDLLKCDIEGAEYGVLTDDLLDPAKISQMIVEFHDLEKNIDEFSRIMNTCRNRGYAIFDEHGNPVGTAEDQLKNLNLKDSQVIKFCSKQLLN